MLLAGTQACTHALPEHPGAYRPLCLLLCLAVPCSPTAGRLVVADDDLPEEPVEVPPAKPIAGARSPPQHAPQVGCCPAGLVRGAELTERCWQRPLAVCAMASAVKGFLTQNFGSAFACAGEEKSTRGRAVASYSPPVAATQIAA